MKKFTLLFFTFFVFCISHAQTQSLIRFDSFEINETVLHDILKYHPLQLFPDTDNFYETSCDEIMHVSFCKNSKTFEILNYQLSSFNISKLVLEFFNDTLISIYSDSISNNLLTILKNENKICKLSNDIGSYYFENSLIIFDRNKTIEAGNCSLSEKKQYKRIKNRNIMKAESFDFDHE